MLGHRLPINPAAAISPEQRARLLTLIEENPWLIPATAALQVIPAAVLIHGYWKNRQLKKQLQIERERTKQLRLQADEPDDFAGHPRPLHLPHPHFHH
ncbi:hypothetical protein FD13_GL001709 [Levilactobacillus senmaizukei DSM 21775 = NBRC 103853]|uniref:Transposase n=1 Tax=Levilactobacillus senmaizukei DSM 21775 = NBRC 103853 TaxID=1423803 RepID=A0A0R2DQY8_9LACO|nr:hypothetical protein [Levilactobacillus senmaizukei]KRN02714.1 hypothetical protein FD13_GL001709 [Levilactobacillus senmaizukei DSM 21775 = NBRC 103853]